MDHSEREVRKQILSARGFSRDSLLDRENTREEQSKITFNLTYYPVFHNAKNISAELQLLLTPDDAHKAVFTKVPIIGFKNDRSFKDHIVRALLLKVDEEGRSKPCGGRDVLVRYLNDTSHFKRRDAN